MRLGNKRGFTPLEPYSHKVSYEGSGLSKGTNSVYLQKRYFMRSPMGVTLLEILIVLAIMGIIATALYQIMKAGINSWETGKDQTDSIAQGRVAMDRMTREIRAASDLTGGDSHYVTFTVDLGNGTETITYSWYGDGDKRVMRGKTE